MHLLSNAHRSFAISATLGAALIAFSTAPVVAQGKGKGKVGGGSNAAFKIINLPGPYHALDGYSQTYAKRVSNVAADGSVYVLGHHLLSGVGYDPKLCLWTINAAGSISVADVSDTLERNSNAPEDVNSAGVICGTIDGRPALRLLNGDIRFLEEPDLSGVARSLNDPDADGVFQVVGSRTSPPIGPMLWNVHEDGSVVSSVRLALADGDTLWADHICNSGIMGGVSSAGPSIGGLDDAGQLIILPRTNPYHGIGTLSGYRVDDAGSLVTTFIPTGSPTLPTLWLEDGSIVDLKGVSGSMIDHANDVALVDGVPFVVGRASDGRSPFAYIYTPGVFSDLGSMAKGDESWSFLEVAEGINRRGMICGTGRVGSRKSFEIHGYLLLPN